MRLAVQRSRPPNMALPARLVVLVVLALALGSLSIAKLRAGPAAMLLHRPDVGFRDLSPTLGAAATDGQQVQQVQQPQPEQPTQQQQQQQEQQQQPEPPGACFTKYPWIEPALEGFFEPARRSAQASKQTTEEALAALRGIMWGKYHPGMDEVVLRYNPDSKRVEVEVVEVAPPNQPHKKRCMVGLLVAAVAAHEAEVAALLAGRELRLIIETEDFGLVFQTANWKLPSFAMCTDDKRIDIPVPDFTFGCYPEARYRNSSWPAIQDLLQRKSDMVGWHERHSELFHRSNWGVGPRKGLMPLLQSYANGSAGVSAVEALGAELDIEDTGFVAVKQGQALRKHDSFVWLDGQCDYKYLIHTAGFSYSGGLKYKLACGSMVFKFASPFVEFFEPALKDGVHVVALPAGKDGVDVEQFKRATAPRIKEVVQRTIGLAEQPPIPRQGQQFVREQLTREALHCYWLGALQRYAPIYFS